MAGHVTTGYKQIPALVDFDPVAWNAFFSEVFLLLTGPFGVAPFGERSLGSLCSLFSQYFFLSSFF